MGEWKDSSGGDTIPTTCPSISCSEAVVESGLFLEFVGAFNVPVASFHVPVSQVPSDLRCALLLLDSRTRSPGVAGKVLAYRNG